MTYASVPTRVSSLPDGTALSRYLMVLGESRGDSHRALLLAEQWPTTPTVKATFDLAIKGAVAPGTTSDATFAGPLAVHGIAAEALQALRGASILGALEGRFRRIPFRTTVPREIGNAGGAWVGESLATPVAATAFDSLSQEAYKASVIVVLSRELLRIGDPDAERTVRQTTVAGVAAVLDSQFLTSTVTLIAGTRPAAVTAGATAITSTGSTAAQMNADLAAMLAAVTTPGPLVFVMRPGTAYRIAATIGGTAAVNVPLSLFGVPLVLSANSPAQITLLDPSQILYSDTGAIDISASEQAAVQLDDAPADPTVSATVLTSLWQANLWGLRVTRWISYLRTQTSAVSYMTVSY
jgi:HK97 family phage major capsid protein